VDKAACRDIYGYPSDLPYLSILHMMPATKINSSKSDRCPTIPRKNGTRHVERGISSSGELDFQEI